MCGRGGGGGRAGLVGRTRERTNSMIKPMPSLLGSGVFLLLLRSCILLLPTFAVMSLKFANMEEARDISGY